MSYDSRKTDRGQEFVEELVLRLDGCQFSFDPYGDQNIFVRSGSTVYGPAATGFTLTSTSPTFTAWYALWSGYPSGSLYAAVSNDGEIVKCEILNSTQILISARGQFGTTAVSITANKPFRFMHIGEADGSCRGFSQTCSDPLSFADGVIREVPFCTGQRLAGASFFPGLYHQSIDYDSAEIDPGESQGSPAKLKVTIQDFVNDDRLIVPYENKRSPYGTFFGKLMARNPFMNGRAVIYRAGLRDSGGFVDPDFIERHFIIDSVNLSGGNFTCDCLDPTILAEDKKAKIPVISSAQLIGVIGISGTSFSYANAPNYYFGAMSSVIYVRVDSEIIKCIVSGATQLTVVTRGYRSTTSDHSEGATIQDCVVFSGVHVIDAIIYSLQSYTKMPAAYIGDYTAVKALIPTIELDEAIISKPMAVNEFIAAMIKLGNLIYYFDESLLKIIINYIPELSIDPVNIDESEQILRGSVKVNKNTKEQYTRFAHLWAPVDVTKDADENYAINYMAINLDVESDSKMGEVNEKKTYKNPLLNTSSNDSLIGTSYASRVIENAGVSPQIITATINSGSVGATQGGSLDLGSIINIVTKESQGIDGQPTGDAYQVLKISGNAYKNFEIKARRYLSVQPADVDFVVDEGGINFNLSSVYAPSAGHYTVYINPGVEFGSYSTAIPAFTTGAQDPGVSFHIIHRGKMLGMGGNGGDAGLISTSPTDGLPGGAAFEATVPCTIDTGSGLIWAGGGGGGSAKTESKGGGGGFVYYSPASGGGGGQGFGVSVGGQYTNGGSLPIPAVPSHNGRELSGGQSSPGTSGFYGGAWGSPGSTGGGGTLGIFGYGGAAGEAIKSNGNTVTIVAGNNDFNIRGRRT